MSSNGWQEIKLGDIASIKGGKRLPKGINLLKEKNNHPYIRVRDVGNSKNLFLNDEFDYVDEETQKLISRYIVNTGDIIISIVGTIGLVSIIDKSLNNANLTENCVKVKEISNMDRDFLYYYLISGRGQHEISKGTVGAVQAKLPLKNIHAINIVLPTVYEQKAIAATLTCLDDKIELNNRINKNLEEMAQAIFKSWFVDFEPFQEGEFEDSELGRIPKGWMVGTIGDVASITSGKRPQIKQESNSDDLFVPVVGASCIMAFTNETLFDEKILITGRVGTHGIIQRFNTPCWPSDNTLVIKSEKYEFVYQILKSIDYKSLNRGSTQPLITQTDLKNIRIIIPPGQELDDFENITSEIMSACYENNNQNKILIQIREALLPKLMSGEIRVPLEEVQ